jgi:hypothetical protein
VKRAKRAAAYLSAVMRHRVYAPTADCWTCGDVEDDDAGERLAFAVALDLGLQMGDGLERLSDDQADALDGSLEVLGVPFCERCVSWVVAYGASVSMRPPPPDCPCNAIPWLRDMRGRGLVQTIPQCAFAFGLVLGDDAKRCEVCQALAQNRRG